MYSVHETVSGSRRRTTQNGRFDDNFKEKRETVSNARARISNTKSVKAMQCKVGTASVRWFRGNMPPVGKVNQYIDMVSHLNKLISFVCLRWRGKRNEMRQSKNIRWFVVSGLFVSRREWCGTRVLKPRYTEHKRIQSNIQDALKTSIHKINYSFSIQFLFTYCGLPLSSVSLCWFSHSHQSLSESASEFQSIFGSSSSHRAAYLQQTIQT